MSDSRQDETLTLVGDRDMRNQIVTTISALEGYEASRDSLRRRTKRNCDRAMALEEAMFNWRSRYLILVLTLGYKREWKPFVTLEQLQRDRGTLFANARSNALLRGIHGYGWKVEEGEALGGLHMHLVVFYDGQHRGDVHIADLICDYWDQVATQGRGDSWSSNRNKAACASGRWGNITGRVDRGDVEKREGLRQYLINYLCKEDQQVSGRAHSRVNCFGTSQF